MSAPGPGTRPAMAAILQRPRNSWAMPAAPGSPPAVDLTTPGSSRGQATPIVSRRLRTLAWLLGVLGSLACAAAIGAVFALGAPDSFLPMYVTGILMGLLGGLVAGRQPSNSVGWLMCVMSVAFSLVHLLAGYGYEALIVQDGAWPLGSVALWVGAWGWVPVFALLPLIAIRFPNGTLPPHGRAIDMVAVAGVSLAALSIALGPAEILIRFLPVPRPRLGLLSPYVANPLGVAVSEDLLRVAGIAGVTLVAAAYVGAAWSLAARLRRARGDERLQLEWFVYAAVLIAATIVYAALAYELLGQPLDLALTPLEFVGLTLPVAIGIAILHYRLYDIDLVVNRTLVYASLTAILAALYSAVITFLQRLFISASGQKSDTATVIAAFFVVVAFSPIREWLQHQVDRRVAHQTPAAVLDRFRTDVDAVLSVMDVRRLAYRLLDRAVVAFDARGAALYLGSSDASEPTYGNGRLHDDAGLEVQLRYDTRQLGRLVMGTRRGDAPYTRRDLDALQLCADSVAEAMALADRAGEERAERVGSSRSG